jgi:hypothetical protein
MLWRAGLSLFWAGAFFWGLEFIHIGLRRNTMQNFYFKKNFPLGHQYFNLDPDPEKINVDPKHTNSRTVEHTLNK